MLLARLSEGRGLLHALFAGILFSLQAMHVAKILFGTL